MANSALTSTLATQRKNPIPGQAYGSGNPMSNAAYLGPELVTALPNLGKGLAAGFAGLPSDLASMLLATAESQFGMGNTAHPRKTLGNLPYGAEDLGQRMGADTGSPSFMLGDIGAPDPKDAALVSAKLLNNPQLMSTLAGMTAFHGSPHKFDKFDIKKIGTGEGAQAYGHGLYFAENKGVAESYLSGGNTFDLVRKPGSDVSDRAWFALEEQSDFGQTEFTQEWFDGALEQLEQNLKRNPDTPHADRKVIDELRKAGLQAFEPSNPSLYEVDIPDEAVAKMLDWDAPLSEQPEEIKSAVDTLRENLIFEAEEMGNEDARKALLTLRDMNEIDGGTGEAFYRALWQIHKTPEAASEALLLDYGIPGIKYLDGSSRAAGEGTRNLVLFDEDLATITSRNKEKVTK